MPPMAWYVFQVAGVNSAYHAVGGIGQEYREVDATAGEVEMP